MPRKMTKSSTPPVKSIRTAISVYGSGAYAAEANGIAKRDGSLKAGKNTDVEISNGNPLDIRIVLDRVIVNGETVFAAEE